MYIYNAGPQANDWQQKMDDILDTVTAIKAVVGIQSYLTHAAPWAPCLQPKKSAGSASLAAMCDSDFKKHIAEAMGAREDVYGSEQAAATVICMRGPYCPCLTGIGNAVT